MTSEHTAPRTSNSSNGQPAWHALPPEFAAARLQSSTEHGLSSAEAQQRLAAHGPNQYEPLADPRQSLRRISLVELLRPSSWLLVALVVLLVVSSTLYQALLVAAAWAVLLGARISFQLRVQRTLALLERLRQRPAVVRREGRRQQIPAEEVVPGDLILLEHGRLIPAEARLVSATSLQVCYPPVSTRHARLDKSTDAVLDNNTPPEKQTTMVHPGMLVCRGMGSAIVIATGEQATRLSALPPGRSADRAVDTDAQRRFKRRARWLTALALAASLLLPALAWWRGQSGDLEALLEMLGLAFALLPLDGAAIAALMLSLGAVRLVQRGAVVRDLHAMETLSAVSSVLCSKTGLLTDGQLEVQRSVPAAWNRQLMEIALMTTITEVETSSINGSESPRLDISASAPQEAALLRAAEQAGLEIAALRASRPIDACFQVDPLRRRTSVVYRRGVRRWVSVRGAPEAVLAACTRRWTADGIDRLTEVDRQAIVETAAVLAEGGGRVIALAERSLPAAEARQPLSPATVERELNFAGLLALTDQLRPESARAMRQCRRAGIQVLLVTGDHPVAARAVGLQSTLGLSDMPVLTGRELSGLEPERLKAALYEQRILARINPKEKMQVLQTLQQAGGCVAVTGRYPLEAPVLAAADLGVTRENASSDAAHLAANLLLVDGRFSTLVQAIAHGRWTYSNFSKTLSLYLAGKVGLLIAAALPLLFGLPLPLSLPQFVLIGLTLAAVVPWLYASEPPGEQLMRQPPRQRERSPFTPEQTARLLRAALGLIIVMTITYFGSLLSIGDLPRARMLAFCSWMWMLVLIAYSLRSDSRSLLRQNPFNNRSLFIWGSLTMIVTLLLGSFPTTASLLGGGVLSPAEWLFGLIALVAGLLIVEVRKWAAGRRLRR